MARNKTKALPHFASTQKLVAFFETHDLGDYWDAMPDADFEIQITKRTHLVSLDPTLVEQVSAIARAKHMSSRTLITKWLREKVAETQTS